MNEIYKQYTTDELLDKLMFAKNMKEKYFSARKLLTHDGIYEMFEGPMLEKELKLRGIRIFKQKEKNE